MAEQHIQTRTTTPADDALTDIKKILNREYPSGGVTVTNCVMHINQSILERPRDCKLCQADILNVLSRALAANEWLNEWKSDITEAFRRFSKYVIQEIEDVKSD